MSMFAKRNGTPEPMPVSNELENALSTHQAKAQQLRETVQRRLESREHTPTPVESHNVYAIVKAAEKVLELHGCNCDSCKILSSLIHR